MIRNQHVVRHTSGWAVKGAGAQKASSVHSTQRDAISSARQVARNQGSELFVHGRNGRIRERNTYSQDPFPPRG